jgi:STE24 endopeptidase
MTTAFTLAFLAAMLATTLLRLWLARRHMHHIAAHRAEVPAVFRDSITLESHQKAADYSVAKLRLALIETVVGALFVLALTLGGILQALHSAWAGLFAAGGYAHGIAFIASLAVLSFIVDLPFTLYRTFVIEERFGFNKMTARLWLIDLVKGTLIGAAVGLPVLLAVLWLMARMGSHWWLYVWLFWMGFNLLVLLIYPTLIAPLFNKFTPLADAAMKARIEALLARCGFRSSGLFVMDGSKRSAHGNAYFTGFGAAKRIVFFDTLLERLKPEEVEAVLAHELGHYKHRHVWKRIGLLALASLGFLWLLGTLIVEPWFYNGLGMSSQGTAAALVLFAMVIPLFTFPLAPLMSALSRRHEYEADAYAAQQTQAGDLVAALVKLYRDNAATLTPDPIYSTFYDSHPPAAARIAHLRAAL